MHLLGLIGFVQLMAEVQAALLSFVYPDVPKFTLNCPCTECVPHGTGAVPFRKVF